MDMIGKNLGNLKIVSKIGEGGMGVVYKAEHIRLKNKFAVKSLTAALTEDPTFRERFHQEAQNQALLDHSNIVQAIDFFEEGNQFFFVMKFADGQGLDQIIKDRAPLAEEEALTIFKGILSGLNFAHSKGIIHRDIKPSNVIVDETMRARITDFGIAILVGDKRLTSTGTNVGSPWYMSPEQIQHPSNIDHRADVYSAGIVLYELLTGEVPFDAETEFSVKNKQINEKIPDPTLKNPKIPQGLVKIIMKALEKDPDARFSGCGEFLETIKAYEKPAVTRPIRSLWQVLAVLALTSTLIMAYMIINGANNEKTDQNGPSRRQEHESANSMIDRAAERTALLCREFKTLERKEERMQIGLESLGGSANVDQLRTQIREHKDNISDYLKRYRDIIIKLSAIEKAIVDEEFNNYNQFLIREKLVPRTRITRIVYDHYQEAQKNKLEANTKVIRKFCLQQ